MVSDKDAKSSHRLIQSFHQKDPTGVEFREWDLLYNEHSILSEPRDYPDSS
jgi:hypothetical protein